MQTIIAGLCSLFYTDSLLRAYVSTIKFEGSRFKGEGLKVNPEP